MAKRPGRDLLSKKCLPLTYLSFKYTVNWQIYWLWNFFSLLRQIRIRVHLTIEPKVFSLSRSIIWTQFRKLWSSIFLQQWDKIGLFQKFLAANFLSKNSLNTLATIWATLKSITHQYKLSWLQFGQIWATFYFNIWSHWSGLIFALNSSMMMQPFSSNDLSHIKDLLKPIVWAPISHMSFDCFANSGSIRNLWSSGYGKGLMIEWSWVWILIFSLKIFFASYQIQIILNGEWSNQSGVNFRALFR